MPLDQACFKFKASFSPCTILQLMRYDLSALEHQLKASLAEAPQLFQGSPVILDLEKIQAAEDISFEKIKQILISAGLVPVGARGGSQHQIEAAQAAGWPSVAVGKNASVDTSKNKSEDKTIVVPVPAKLITQPVRSGMQVYAKDCDLIVVGQVSAGAELLADGHIHVYGALRGRALAGVQGNINARIFCRTLEAELVSIAGYYLTKEDMQTLSICDGMIQIYLQNEQVKIAMV